MTRLAERIESFRFSGFKDGVRDTVYRMFNKLTYFKALRCIVIMPDEVNPKYLVAEDGYQFGFADKATLLENTGEELSLGAEFIEAACDRGDRCFVVTHEGQIVSYGWYSSKPTEIENGLFFEFSPQDMYMYKGFTSREHRGKRLHAVGLCKAIKELAKERPFRLVSYVESNNYRSLRSCARMGFRPVGLIYIIKAFGKYRIRTQAACRSLKLTVSLTA